MQKKHRFIKFIKRAFFPTLALLVLMGQASAQAALTLGHQVILEKGLQLKTMVMPADIYQFGGTFNVEQYRALGFNTIDLWTTPGSYDYHVNMGYLPGGSNALNFAKVATNTTPSLCSATYLPNLVSVQYGDEQDFTPSAYQGWATAIATLKAKAPNAIVYMNNDEDAYSSVSTSTLNTFVQSVKPDMLSFTSYPFRWQNAPYHNYYGGSPTFFYRQVELYRKAGLAGLTGDGSQPIPVSMFVQTFATTGTSTVTNHRQPTESEFRLQQFAGWAAGMKSVDAFLYENYPGMDSMFLEGTNVASQTPTTQFYQYKELNRQSAHLGPALVRLISTGFRMKMGSHGTTPVTNTLPEGVTAFNTTADPYLTSITATNLGTCNNGLSGDVLYGAFKPLDPSLVAAGSENDRYFMIVNGLTDGAASLASACRQTISLTFDFGTSGITNLLRLSRETGLVEEVALTYLGTGGRYSFDLTLDGGTGDLFKYNTGTAFVPEPSGIVLLATGLIGLLAYASRKRKR